MDLDNAAMDTILKVFAFSLFFDLALRAAGR